MSGITPLENTNLVRENIRLIEENAAQVRELAELKVKLERLERYDVAFLAWLRMMPTLTR